MLRDGMDLFWAALQAARWAGCPYALENPTGRIAGLYAESEHSFSPWEYSSLVVEDNYHKQTCLWTGGGFVMPEPQPLPKVAEAVALVRSVSKNRCVVTKANARKLLPENQLVAEWYPDDRIHLASPGDDRSDVRSATPMGFAQAVFLANAPRLQDHSLAA